MTGRHRREEAEVCGTGPALVRIAWAAVAVGLLGAGFLVVVILVSGGVL